MINNNQIFRIPEVDMDVDLLKKFNPDDFDENTYCSFVESLTETCYIKNILDLWGNNKRKIRNLTKNDIIAKFNRNKIQ